MVFSSTVFLLLFLPAVYIVSQFVRNTHVQNILLIAASLFFYAYGEGLYVLLMLGCALCTFLCIRLLNKAGMSRGRRKIILFSSVLIQLSVLFVFKYAGLFGAEIPLPIGISFFTFQSISLSADAYRSDDALGDIRLTDVLLYVTFFPQLIAGPIVRFQDIRPSLRERSVSGEDSLNGLYRFCAGLGKKVLLANSLALAAVSRGWIGAAAYMLQIYFDFSGYSDMAIGLGMLFGFRFRENFRLPYCASSPKDFWRRWHISLSEWFRDYLYIPLGGSRKGMWRTFFNVMLVFLCTGIWHGAGLTFLLWGVWNGIFVAVQGLIEHMRGRKISPEGPAKIFGTAFTLLFVLLGFVIFKSENMKEAVETYRNMFTFRMNTDVFGLFDLRMCAMSVIAVIMASPAAAAVSDRISKSSRSGLIKGISCVILLVTCISVLFAGSYNPFIYFRF